MIIPELPVTEPCSSCTRDEGEEGAGGAEGSTVGPSGLVTPTSELPCFTDASDTGERVFCTSSSLQIVSYELDRSGNEDVQLLRHRSSTVLLKSPCANDSKNCTLFNS